MLKDLFAIARTDDPSTTTVYTKDGKGIVLDQPTPRRRRPLHTTTQFLVCMSGGCLFSITARWFLRSLLSVVPPWVLLLLALVFIPMLWSQLNPGKDPLIKGLLILCVLTGCLFAVI